MHQESYDIVEHFAATVAHHLKDRKPIRVLDVGSQVVGGSQSYKTIFNNEVFSYVGLDVELGENVNIVPANPYDWKLNDAFDLIVSGQAFEHIEYPWLTIKEIEKAMTPGAYAILVAPTIPIIHRYPVDCWRILPDGWTALAKWSGLEMLYTNMNMHGTWYDSYCLLRKKAQ